MKFFRNLLLILATIFIFEVTFTKDANASDACTKTGDVLDVVTDWCETTPDEYEVVIYKLYLCTSSPTIPTTTSAVDLTSGGCEQIFDNPSGATVSYARLRVRFNRNIYKTSKWNIYPWIRYDG